MKLKFRLFDLLPRHTFEISRGATTRAQVILLELSDPTTTGLGEAAPLARYDESASTVQEALSLVDPDRLAFTDIPGSMSYLERLLPAAPAARSALNIALMDGAARMRGLRVHNIVGLGFRENHHTTSFTIGIADPATIRHKTRLAHENPILKCKVGSKDDEAILAALREVAPLKPLRVDANEAWRTKEQALRMIEVLAEDGNIQFVEQPMPSETPLQDLIWLKERSPLPLFADESFRDALDVAACAEAFHGANVKLAKAGGIVAAGEALRAAHLAGLKTMVGCMLETSISITAAVHLADLCDYLDLDGNLLISNDPYLGATVDGGLLSLASAEPTGLGIRKKPDAPAF